LLDGWDTAKPRLAAAGFVSYQATTSQLGEIGLRDGVLYQGTPSVVPIKPAKGIGL
jgi:hypothetical protein